jgi:hypothetical protein
MHKLYTRSEVSIESYLLLLSLKMFLSSDYEKLWSTDSCVSTWSFKPMYRNCLSHLRLKIQECDFGEWRQ